jgi:hypothetical protein
MFIELTEIIADRLSTYASTPKERPVSINVDKIQAFRGDPSTDWCIIEMRRQSIKVRENYETIKDKIKQYK